MVLYPETEWKGLGGARKQEILKASLDDHPFMSYFNVNEYATKKALHFVGYGRTNAMCSSSKVAVTINKEHGYYGCVLIAAHEMGHK